MALSDEEKRVMANEVIEVINHYTDEDVKLNITSEEAKKIQLLKHLGIGPTLVGQLSVPFTKVSRRHNGKGVGLYDAQGAKTVQDCIDLVLKSVLGGSK